MARLTLDLTAISDEEMLVELERRVAEDKAKAGAEHVPWANTPEPDELGKVPGGSTVHETP